MNRLSKALLAVAGGLAVGAWHGAVFPDLSWGYAALLILGVSLCAWAHGAPGE